MASLASNVKDAEKALKDPSITEVTLKLKTLTFSLTLDFRHKQKTLCNELYCRSRVVRYKGVCVILKKENF